MREVELVQGRMCNLPMHPPDYAETGDPPRPYRYHVNLAFLLKDEHSNNKPHIGGTVVDATEAKEGQVLRSEVAAAVGLLKHQFQRGDFCLHHTLPAIVFSFQHDKWVGSASSISTPRPNLSSCGSPVSSTFGATNPQSTRNI
ncbi:hypothetical protein MFIFM68171_04132 [Madurella fahalii]|uniref:Uncharacterized protein n=1 Tax=Madurella fahalii TaxID=1157608 RepID=A0ABQ0G869_9PEZI